jgi:outer membrane lipoprotein SlyB
MNRVPPVVLIAFLPVLSLGCRSMDYTDRGALFGGLTGAGVGAVVGDASGNAGAGALIGSALGAVTGAVVGEGIDADVARSKAEIEARMGRQMQGAVTPQDVIAMTQAGLSDDVIVTHIRANGMAQPLAVNDLIGLRNMGVRDSVINAMQQTPPRLAQSTAVYPAYPVPAHGVIVEHYYQPWCPPPRPAFHVHQHRPRGQVHWGIAVGH